MKPIYYKYLDHDEKEDSVKPSFNTVKPGTIFNIQRPSFKADEVAPINSKIVGKVLKSKRSGTGNYNIKRESFLAPDIMGRYTIDFDKLELQNLQQDGIKVRLGDKTLRDIFDIQIDDPTDMLWLAEKDRRLASAKSGTPALSNAFAKPLPKNLTPSLNLWMEKLPTLVHL